MKERNRIRSENKNRIKEAIAAIEKTAAESGIIPLWHTIKAEKS